MARLTVHPPNGDAAELAAHIKRQAKRAIGYSCETQCCSGVFLFVAFVGFIWNIAAVGLGVAAGASIGVVAGGVLFILFFFVVLPLAKVYVFLVEEYFQNDDVSDQVHLALQEQLNERMKRTQLLSNHNSNPPEEEEEATLVAGLFSDEAFSAMKSSGYASTTAWAVYASVRSSLMTTTTQVNDGDGDDDDSLHAQWLKIVQSLVVAAGGFVTRLDDRRISAKKRLARFQRNTAMDQFGDLLGIATAKNELQELKESLQSIKNDAKDIK